MSPGQLAVTFIGISLLATLLAGLIFRRRVQACISFTLYVVAVFVPTLLFAIQPRFHTLENYFLRETVHNVLKLAIALELGYRTFRAFPSALAYARRMTFVILSVVAVIAVSTPTSAQLSTDLAEWHARVLNGTIWLLTGMAAIILWYRLPVDSFHKAILVGFVPYLLVFSVGMRAIVEMGLAESHVFHRVHTIAYVLLLAYWNRAAWAARAHSVLRARMRSRQPEPAWKTSGSHLD